MGQEIIDFKSLTRLDITNTHSWGNIDPEEIAIKYFAHLVRVFPELITTSDVFNNKIKQAIKLAFIRINKLGETNHPKLNEVVICTFLSVSSKDLITSNDSTAYRKLMSLRESKPQ